MPGEKVFVGRCASYDPKAIAEVIARGLTELAAWDLIYGKVAIKPNLVLAHPVEARHGYTRAEFMEAVLTHLATLRERGRVTRVDIVEKCGRGAPTRDQMKNAGYFPLARRFDVGLHPMEEEPRVWKSLSRSIWHKEVQISPVIADAETIIFTPKLKSNVLAHGISAALKLNVGSVDDDERMLFHDHRLDDKIVDLLEAVYPRLVITDAIEIGAGGNQMTQAGYPLGAIIIATNPLAHDLVAARLMGLDPAKVGHLARAIARGYRPASVEEVEVVGDYPLTDAQAFTATIDLGFMRVEEFKCPMAIKSGEPYCTGGCHGVFLDWLHMIKDRRPDLVTKLPGDVAVVIGEAKEPVSGKRVLLYGDCAAKTQVASGKVVRIAGCPPNHKDTILWMWLKMGVVGPLFRPELIWAGYGANPARRALGWFRRLAAPSRTPPPVSPPAPPSAGE